MIDPNDLERGMTEDRQGDLRGDVNQPVSRPYADAGDLYDIPPVRPDDPPMRKWWIDDEGSDGESESQQKR